jgi:adenosylcobinamide-phosphate synthase
MNFSTSLVISYLLDLALGDPRWIPHPVRGIGRLISFLDKSLNRGKDKTLLKMKGVLLALIVIFSTFFLTLAITRCFDFLSPYLKWISVIVLSFFCLSTRDLYDHGMRIFKRLEEKDIEGARLALSLIVSRETCHMDEEDVVRSTVESIGENTNDGICAPLFYLLLGGPVLCIIYKAVNTLDSMVGYKNEKYLYFGWFSAKLDDIINFVPARISGLLIALSTLFYYRSFSYFVLSLETLLRDGRKHASPNSGYPEAAIAGALGIRVSGPSIYGGKVVNKPFIGEDRREIGPHLIREALHISILSSIFMLFGGIMIRGI